MTNHITVTDASYSVKGYEAILHNALSLVAIATSYSTLAHKRNELDQPSRMVIRIDLCVQLFQV